MDRLTTSTPFPRAVIAAFFACATLVGPRAASAQPAPPPEAPTGETKGFNAPFLDLPLRELGDSFADATYGFEFRRPIGFGMIANIEQLRDENILPEEQRTGSNGVLEQVQIYLFREQSGTGDANILIRANEPAQNIQSPQELRAFFTNPDSAAGIATKNIGKLYQVKMRGGDIAFFAERQIGNQFSGGQITAHQYMAYIRTGARSLLLSFTAPVDRFPELADTFKACLGSFILRDNPQRDGDNSRRQREAKRFGGITSRTVLINLGIVAVLITLLLKFLRSGPSIVSRQD